MLRRAPWEHQREAADAVLAAWSANRQGPAVVLPTGSGKTGVKAIIGDEYLAQLEREGDLDGRVLAIAHRDELLGQIQSAFREGCSRSTGIVQANRNEAAAQIVCASVQTLGGKDDRRRRMIRNVRAVLVDECHHGAADSYRRVIDHYVALGAKYMGVTATLVRGDDRALGEVFTEVVYAKSIAAMIAKGFLVRPRAVRVKVADLDLDAVRRTAGDLQAGQLGEAIEHSLAPEAIAKAIMEQCPIAQGFIFAPTVKAAEVIATAVRDAGLSCVVVTGSTPRLERASILGQFRAGSVRWLVNVGVFTEGTDLPMAEVCVIARPTQSVGLYIQMVGRVLRRYCVTHPRSGCFELCPDRKRSALILDVVGATKRHCLASPIDLFGADRREAKAELDDLDMGDLLDGLDLAGDDPTEGVDDWDFGGVNGPLEYQAVDLFKASAVDWRQTDKGMWYLSAGDRFVVILPGIATGTWDVWDMHNEQAGRAAVIMRGVTRQDEARLVAETQVSAGERNAASRKRYGRVASEAVRRHAARWGVVAPEGTTAAELDQLLDARKANVRIDQNLPWYARGRA